MWKSRIPSPSALPANLSSSSFKKAEMVLSIRGSYLTAEFEVKFAPIERRRLLCQVWSGLEKSV